MQLQPEEHNSIASRKLQLAANMSIISPILHKVKG